jgi:hypothetical protein
MRIKKALLIMIFFVFLMGFSGGQRATAVTANPHISEECIAEIKAVLRSCAEQCPRNLRCFIRCVITNYPTCAFE